jgi:hydrogenase expression/formation protein HypE
MNMLPPKPPRRFVSKLDIARGAVEMTHGSGGRAATQLIEELFLRHFDNDALRQASDQALLPRPQGRIVVSTDSHVVSPIFFPGGDIGSLAVNGTVNDVAMAGARPLWLSAGFIIEEGYPLADLDRIVGSMAEAARHAGVSVVTGDTKVVERGKGDGVFIATTGIGVVPDGVHLAPRHIMPGDRILISGTIGDHGVAILSKRENLQFESEIVSDCAALNGLVSDMIAAVPTIHAMRDPTRGGLSAVLNELADASGTGMVVDEAELAVGEDVAAACELLGLDPLNIANEGKLVAFCAAADASRLLDVMRAHPLGANAAIIGEVVADRPGMVRMRTRFGGERVVDWLSGEQLPRIC